MRKRTFQHGEWLAAAETLVKSAEEKVKKAALNIAKTKATKAQRLAKYTDDNKAVKKSARKVKRRFTEKLAKYRQKIAQAKGI